MAFCCVSCCCYRDPPQAATPCCRYCCRCLIRGSSGGAGVAACGGGSGSSSNGSSGSASGAILVILLLFARPLLIGIVLPLFATRCAFCRPLLTHHQCAMVGCCLLLSTALFVITHCPAIIDDCIAGCWLSAHLIALVLLAASAFVALRTRSSLSLLSLRAEAWACWWAQSLGRDPAGPPSLAAVVIVLTARRSGGRTK